MRLAAQAAGHVGSMAKDPVEIGGEMSNRQQKLSFPCQIDWLLNIHKSYAVRRQIGAALAAWRRKPPKAAQRKRPIDQPPAAESDGRGRRRSRRAPTGARATRGGRREAAGDPGCGSVGRRTSDRLAKPKAGLGAKPQAGLEAKTGRERAAPPGLPAAYRTHNKPPPGDRHADRCNCSIWKPIHNTML